MVEIQADEYGGGSAAADAQRAVRRPDARPRPRRRPTAPSGTTPRPRPSRRSTRCRCSGCTGAGGAPRSGHLAAVEMTSSEPSRRYSAGLRRLGFDERTTVFYDEHVEADAVHEQIASVDMCGSLVAEEPDAAARRPLRRRLLAGHGRRRRAAPARRLGGRPLGAAAGRRPRRLTVTRPVGVASRRIACAAGRGRLGALGAEKPDRLCVPSQKGLMPDFPHRQSAIVSPAGIDLGAVLVDQPEVAADDQRPVPVGRDRRAARPAAGAASASSGRLAARRQGGRHVPTLPRRPAGTRTPGTDPSG